MWHVLRRKAHGEMLKLRTAYCSKTMRASNSDAQCCEWDSSSALSTTNVISLAPVIIQIGKPHQIGVGVLVKRSSRRTRFKV